MPRPAWVAFSHIPYTVDSRIHVTCTLLSVLIAHGWSRIDSSVADVKALRIAPTVTSGVYSHLLLLVMEFSTHHPLECSRTLRSHRPLLRLHTQHVPQHS